MINKKFVTLLLFKICVVAALEGTLEKILNCFKVKEIDGLIVWHSFNATDLDNKTIIEYQIRNIPKHLYTNATDFMMEYYMRYEPICVAEDAINKKEEMKKYRISFQTSLKEGISIACFKGNSETIVGVQMLRIKSGHHDEFTFKVYDKYGAKKFLQGRGMAVDVAYRGRGIGVALLMAREPVCAKLGLTVTSNMFSSKYSIACAKKAGFEVSKYVEYNDVKEYMPDTLPYYNCTEIAVMSKEYTF